MNSGMLKMINSYLNVLLSAHPDAEILDVKVSMDFEYNSNKKAICEKLKIRVICKKFKDFIEKNFIQYLQNNIVWDTPDIKLKLVSLSQYFPVTKKFNTCEDYTVCITSVFQLNPDAGSQFKIGTVNNTDFLQVLNKVEKEKINE